jgi:RNA polymerase sigma-70 factor, ECF subfamily
VVGIPTTKLSSHAEADLSSPNAAGLSAFFPRFGRSSDESVASDVVALDSADSAKNDEHLLLRVQSGDREALGILFDRYARLVLSVGLRIIRDNAEAEDLVHDVFLFLLNKSEHFDPAKGSARAWLAKVTYHRALDRRKYLHKRCYYDNRNNSHSLEKAGGNGESTEFFYWQSYLQHAFDDLSQEQRITLELHFFQGYTINEISERLGTDPGNVRHYYYRGLERLRNHMRGNRRDSSY